MRLKNDTVKLSLGIGYKSEDIPDLQSLQERGSRILRKVDNYELKESNLVRLNADKWLDDEIINSFAHFVNIAKQSKCYVMSTYFPVKYLSRGAVTKQACVESFTRRATNPLITKLMIPVNFENTHWTLAVIDIENKYMLYYDHLDYAVPDKLEDAMRAVVDCIRKSELPQFRQIRQRDPQLADPNQKWQFFKVANITKQTSHSDCGVFVCMDMYHVSQNIEREVTMNQMPRLRRKIYEVLMTKDSNLDILLEWTCKSCNYAENPHEFLKCRECQAERPLGTHTQ